MYYISSVEPRGSFDDIYKMVAVGLNGQTKEVEGPLRNIVFVGQATDSITFIGVNSQEGFCVSNLQDTIPGPLRFQKQKSELVLSFLW